MDIQKLTNPVPLKTTVSTFSASTALIISSTLKVVQFASFLIPLIRSSSIPFDDILDPWRRKGVRERTGQGYWIQSIHSIPSLSRKYPEYSFSLYEEVASGFSVYISTFIQLMTVTFVITLTLEFDSFRKKQVEVYVVILRWNDNVVSTFQNSISSSIQCFSSYLFCWKIRL